MNHRKVKGEWKAQVSFCSKQMFPRARQPLVFVKTCTIHRTEVNIVRNIRHFIAPRKYLDIVLIFILHLWWKFSVNGGNISLPDLCFEYNLGIKIDMLIYILMSLTVRN